MFKKKGEQIPWKMSVSIQKCYGILDVIQLMSSYNVYNYMFFKVEVSG